MNIEDDKDPQPETEITWKRSPDILYRYSKEPPGPVVFEPDKPAPDGQWERSPMIRPPGS